MNKKEINKWLNSAKHLSDEQLLERRLSGTLPVIDIMGYPFIIDWRLKELRPVNDFNTRLDLKTMAMNNDGNKYLCYYHIPTRSEVVPDKSIKELPTDVLLLEIPFELVLDPVGVAREYGLGDTDLLNRYPIQREIKATVIPLEQSYLAEIVKRNNTQVKRTIVRQAPKKGKGRKL